MPKDVAGINRVRGKYVAACNAGDIAAWQNTLTNKVVWMPPDAPKVVGKKAVAASVKASFFDPFKIKLMAKFDRVQVFGSQAVASGPFSLELTPKTGGNTIKGKGKHMDLFRKQKDGSWKYAQAIFNYDKLLA